MVQEIYREMMIKIPPEDFPLNTQEALANVCKDPSIAHFGEMAVAKPYVQFARDYMDCDIVALSHSISEIYSSMALQRHSPYRMPINHL